MKVKSLFGFFYFFLFKGYAICAMLKHKAASIKVKNLNAKSEVEGRYLFICISFNFYVFSVQNNLNRTHQSRT